MANSCSELCQSAHYGQGAMIGTAPYCVPEIVQRIVTVLTATLVPQLWYLSLGPTMERNAGL